MRILILKIALIISRFYVKHIRIMFGNYRMIFMKHLTRIPQLWNVQWISCFKQLFLILRYLGQSLQLLCRREQRQDQRNFHETSEIFSNNKPFQWYFRQGIILWKNVVQNLRRNALQNITNKYRNKIQQLGEGILFLSPIGFFLLREIKWD